MNNREKLFGLNAEFQKLYYDKEFAFFHGTLRDKVNEFISFISSLNPSKQHDSFAVVQNHIGSLQTELLMLEDQKLDYPSGNESKKDFLLLDMKRKISQATWQIFSALAIRDSDVLDKVI